MPKKKKRKSVQVGEGNGVAHFPLADPHEYVKAYVSKVSGSPISKTIWIVQNDLEAVPEKGVVAHTNAFLIFDSDPKHNKSAIEYRVTNLIRDAETGDLEADSLLVEPSEDN